MRFSYTVSCLEPQKKYFHVTLAIDDLDVDFLELKLPTWIPGSYLVRDFVKDLSHLTARASNGRTLKVLKQDKSTWRIPTQGVRRMQVSYRVYGGEPSVHGAYLDSDIGFFNGPCLFLYDDRMREASIDLTLKLPAKWTVATALTSLRGKTAWRYQADNLDVLYDSPVQVSARQALYHFQALGKRHDVVLYGTTLAEHKKIVADIQKIVETEARIFGGLPYERYVFLIQFMPGLYGGLEHAQSSANLFDGLLMGDPEKYVEFLGLISHEFFHIWNVKRIRPRALGPFDYSKETYTHDLWLSEGFTSYYDDHVLYRAGLLSKEDYLGKVLTKLIARYENQPAKQVMSLSESSFDAWVKLYRANTDAPNTLMSYYLKGSLIALLLDLEIIRTTDAKKNLDDVMRALWRAYLKKPELGFVREDIENIIAQVAPACDVRAFFRNYVDGIHAISWESFLKPFGLMLSQNTDATSLRLKESGHLGLQVSERNGTLMVDRVLAESAAHASALQPGDELLAIDSIRLSKEKLLADVLFVTKPNTMHRVLFSRQGRVQETMLKTQKNSDWILKINVKEKMTQKERTLQNRFLRKR